MSTDLITRLRTAANPEYPLGKLMSEAADALAALASPEQREPVAYRYRFTEVGEWFLSQTSPEGKYGFEDVPVYPLFLHPSKEEERLREEQDPFAWTWRDSTGCIYIDMDEAHAAELSEACGATAEPLYLRARATLAQEGK